MWNLKNNTNEIYIQNRKTHRHKANLWLSKRKCRRGKIRSMGLTNYVKQISNKDLLYSTGNYIRYLVIT